MDRKLALIAALVLASCGGRDQGTTDVDAAGETDADDGGDGDDPADAPADGDEDLGDSPEIEEDGPSFDLVNPFTVDVVGNGSIRMADVVLVSGSGSLGLVPGGAVPALAYEMTDWAEYGYTLFHLVAPEADTLNVSYLYCTGSGLAWIWHEDFDLSMDVESATGTCDFSAVSTVVPDPDLLDLVARPTAAQIVTGFTIDGAQISFSTGPGTIVIDGDTYGLYPFEVVDCTTACSADPADGWWELHSILTDGAGSPCFGIIYLMVANPSGAFLGYPVCLDPVSRLDGPTYTAAWTAPPAGGAGVSPPSPIRSPLPLLPWPRPPAAALESIGRLP